MDVLNFWGRKNQDAATLTVAVGKTDRESLSLGLPFANICRGIPYPAPIAANIGRQFHIRNN